MGEQEPKTEKKNICVGLLAHVDAGKTTLAEDLLYLSGQIQKPGRVDHGDAFLDTYALEKARGITIFSKQAELSLGEIGVTLLDTPGHVDFSAEMERTLQVLDYAVLIVSGADGVQGHVETLWHLLERYQVPAFVFINKMDQEGTEKNALLKELQEKLSDNCIEFSKEECLEVFYENLAMCEEAVMEAYLETGQVKDTEIRRLIRERKVVPCYFGSALKLTGVEELMEGLRLYMEPKRYPEEFGARVFKIARDEQGNRLTYLKLTGGSLKVKTPLCGRRYQKRRILKEKAEWKNETNKETNKEFETEDSWTEKVEQIRIYSGAEYQAVNEVSAGMICAVTGLTKTQVGEGLGIERENKAPLLEPVLNYQILLPEDCPLLPMLAKLRQLEEEEPLLHIVWREELQEIHAQLMGEVQLEVFQVLVKERFGVEIAFGPGSIVYKETILEPVEGVGHFEPLRHYAEVHLLLEPLEAGSGLIFDTDCSEDILDRNWQRLVLTHLEERAHRGVLTGSEITDMKITLVNGRAHLKHTEGGDFRQATYRAVRQGLKMAKSCLLEPMYEYSLELPTELVGRAMTDIQKRFGTISAPELVGENGSRAILTGTAPVATMQGYPIEVTAYSKGQAKLFCSLQGYAPCHNEEEIIEAIGYDSERDLEQPTGSVFCAHGAGFLVEWYEVPEYMHLEPFAVKQKKIEGIQERQTQRIQQVREVQASKKQSAYQEDELKAIFERTYGTIQQERKTWSKKVIRAEEQTKGRSRAEGRKQAAHKAAQEYLLVDGYNIMFGWEDLKELAETNIEAARSRLMDILCNYQGYRKMILILVFDAYRVEGNPGSVQDYHNIHVVYTKEAETADQYIEKVTKEIGRKHRVTVATSDALEQVIIQSQGAARLSARELREEIETAEEEIREELERQHKGTARELSGRSYLFDGVPEDVAGLLEEIRLGNSFSQGQKTGKK
ncbi:MAG: GTP-binding protein [Lachnospiraceae bacterium]|nr:GTP-binding protein [Lachnospiraceae bacterium]